MANLILWNSQNNSTALARSLASYQLASWIRQHGYTVKVIDFCHRMTTAELVAITKKHTDSDTLAIGVSTTFWRDIDDNTGIEPKWVIDGRTTLANERIYWLLGGAITKLTLQFNWVRFLEAGEDALLEWMDRRSVKLIRRELFDITRSSTAFSNNDYIQPYEVLSMELGRGCQFRCKFCSYPLLGKKKGTYIRDYNIIKEDLIRNYEELGVTRYSFIDDTVNESEEKVYALANIAQNLPFKLEWVGYNRLDLIWSRPGTIQALKDSGLKSAFFGIESFHPHASAVIGKGWNGRHGKEFLLKLKEEWKDEITWTLGLIAGLPGETPEDLENTLQWCIDSGMYNWNFFTLYIDYGPAKILKSEFDREYKKYGYTFPENNLNWKNDIWTRDEADLLALKLNTVTHSQCSLAGFKLATAASLGYSFDELMHKIKMELPTIEFEKRIDNFIRAYVQNQLK